MLEKIEEYAKANNVPIMEKEGIEFLKDYISKNNVQSILEIGSAIGYSAINFCLVNENIKVTTIERDKKRYEEAVKNIKNFNLEDRINIIFDDAFNVEINDKYDMIFIDAAKAQYIKFFEKFKVNLKDNGVIISDNLKFHGLVDGNYDGLSRNVKGLVRKLKNYIVFLQENKEFKTEFIDVGDGVAVSKKNEQYNEMG